MTEEEWRKSNDSDFMLRFLRETVVAVRKLRAFSASCFESARSLFPDQRQQHGLQILVNRVDASDSNIELRNVTSRLRQAIPLDQWRDLEIQTDDLHYAALMLYREFASNRPSSHATAVADAFVEWELEKRKQSHLLRDIFGNPFRPVAFDPAWRTSTAIGIATGIYDERAFDRMPILADALQDAGCENADIFTHCRVSSGTSVVVGLSILCWGRNDGEPTASAVGELSVAPPTAHAVGSPGLGGVGQLRYTVTSWEVTF
jgi:hypothetical protein